MSDVRWLLFAAETEEHIGRATPEELRQLLANAYVTADNPAGPDASTGAKRRLLIVRTLLAQNLLAGLEAHAA